jgi:hypothetical protein
MSTNPLTSTQRGQRARIAAQSRRAKESDPTAIAEYVEKILAEAPPLNDEQRIRLAELLRTVRRPSSGSGVSLR